MLLTRNHLRSATKILTRYQRISTTETRCFSDKNKDDDDKSIWSNPSTNFENPFKRTGRILKNDLVRAKNYVEDIFRSDPKQKKYTMPLDRVDAFIENRDDIRLFQTHCDVLVIGGGAMVNLTKSFSFHN